MPAIKTAKYKYLICAGALIALVSPARAQQSQPAAAAPQPSANRCAAPEYHQMDFILGNWEVSNKGKKTANATFEPTTTSACGIQETWRNGNGGGGNGLFANSPVGKGWQYFWVPSSGLPTWLHDGKPTGNGDEMQFTLTRTTQDGKSHESHWTLTKDADGKIHEVSVNMETGATEYDLLWTRK
jgi:hypothetical protein